MRAGTAQKAFDLLFTAERSMTTGEVADRLGIVRSCADGALRTLAASGRVKMFGGGRHQPAGHKERNWRVIATPPRTEGAGS